MSESAVVRRVSAGSHLYMKQKGRTAPAKILAKSQHDSPVTITVDSTEELKHFDVARYWSPVTIDATNDKINFVASSGGPEITGSVAHGTYDDPHALAFALRQALHYADTGTGNQEYFVDWDSATYKFTIRHTEESLASGDYFDILWKTGTNGADNTDTHVGSVLGFSDASDDVSLGDALVVGEWVANSTGGADVLPAPAHAPISALTVYAEGVPLTITTDYTVVLATGVVTLVNGQTTVGDQITLDYTWQDPLANTSHEADSPVGSTVSWISRPNLVVPAQGILYYDVPEGSILRFLASAGHVELTFDGSPGFEDPQPLGRFAE